MKRALLLAVLMVPLSPLPAAAAEGDPVTGWWSRTRLGPPVPVEAPSPVPEGGTWVASDPAGPLAVSALRLELAAGVVATGLSLKVDRMDGTPAVRLCPAVARWQPEQGGRLDTAPAHDCKVFVKAEVKAGQLVAAFPPGFTEGFLDVVLAPEPGSTFSLTMQKATAASVTTASAEPAVPEPAFEDAPPPPGVSSTGSSTLPPLSSGVAGPPVLPPPPAPEPVVVGPQVPVGTAPQPAAAPLAAAPLAPVAALPRAAAPDDRREAVPAAVLLVLLGALAMWLQMQPAAAPRRLGGGAGLRTPAAAGAGAAAGAVAAVPAAGGAPAGPPLTAQSEPAPVRGVGRFRAARATRPVRL